MAGRKSQREARSTMMPATGSRAGGHIGDPALHRDESSRHGVLLAGRGLLSGTAALLVAFREAAQSEIARLHAAAASRSFRLAATADAEAKASLLSAAPKAWSTK